MRSGASLQQQYGAPAVRVDVAPPRRRRPGTASGRRLASEGFRDRARVAGVWRLDVEVDVGESAGGRVGGGGAPARPAAAAAAAVGGAGATADVGGRGAAQSPPRRRRATRQRRRHGPLAAVVVVVVVVVAVVVSGTSGAFTPAAA